MNFKLSKKFEKREKLEEIKNDSPNGLCNIGNSCYINALIQNLGILENFEKFFNSIDLEKFYSNCKLNPKCCLLC